jgi:hypothetical protein
MQKKKDIKRVLNSKTPNSFNDLITQVQTKATSILKKKYSAKIISAKYLSIITNSLIFNKNSHLVSTFKDSMIWDYIDEFLKRYYNKPESFDRVPRFASFYKNYLKFFCKPIFINFSANSVLQDYNEKKAELYYNQNFISGNENGDDGNDAIDDDGEDESESKKSKSVSKSKIEKTIFDSTIKRNIDNESINTVVNNNNNKNEITITLPDNEFPLLNESGLLNEYSNEQSLIMLMNCINKKKEKHINNNKHKTNIHSNNIINNNKQISKGNNKQQTNFKPHSRNSNHNLNIKESKFICYTNLCQKKNFQIIKEQNVHSHTKSQTQLKQSSFNNKRSRNIPNANNTNNSTSKFKTFELSSNTNNNNNNNKNRLMKTQNVENILNRITQQVNQNTVKHKRNNYSIDNFISQNSKSQTKTKTFNLMHKKSIKKNTTSKDKKVKGLNYDNNNNKQKGTIKKTITSNNAQTVCNLNLNHNNNNEDLMKKTLAFLITNNPPTTSNKNNNNANNNAIHIQNVNININNQINIGNNYTDKKLNQPLNKPITSISINRKSRNKGGSYDINHNTGGMTGSNGTMFCSSNGLDSQGLNSFMKKNAAKTTYYNSIGLSSQMTSKNGGGVNGNANNMKGIGSIKGKNVKYGKNPVHHHIIKSDNLIKVVPKKLKKTNTSCNSDNINNINNNKLKNLQYKNTNTGNTHTKTSNTNISKSIFKRNTSKSKNK